MKTAIRAIVLAVLVGVAFGLALSYAQSIVHPRATRVTQHTIEPSSEAYSQRLALGEFCPDASGPQIESCWLIWFSDSVALGEAVECWHRPWLHGEACDWPPTRGVERIKRSKKG